jgi:hypothetical protein
MILQIEIPDTLPEGRRSSFKKGIAEALVEAATTRTELEYTPEGHEIERALGKKIGEALVEEIQSTYPK